MHFFKNPFVGSRQRRHGQLRSLPPRRIVPCTSNTAIPTHRAIFPERVVLQPAVQHEDDDPHEEFFAAGNIYQGLSRVVALLRRLN